MATTIEDLLRDVLINAESVTSTKQELTKCETRLLKALETANTPLKLKGQIVIGQTLVRRPYEYMPLEMLPIENVFPGTVIKEGE